MAATGFPRGSPQADSGRPGHLAESQLPGAASYSHWRPAADILMDGDTGEQCATELVEATYFNKYPRSA